MSAKAVVSLGSNLGDRSNLLHHALQQINAIPLTKTLKVSAFLETKPVGLIDQPNFLNAVALLDTQQAPHFLLRHLLEIENSMGRVRTIRWGPRVIDLDLIAYNDLELDTPNLTLPHPRAHERSFVTVPFEEIDPDFCHKIQRILLKKR